MALDALGWVGVGAKNLVIGSWERGIPEGRKGVIPLMFQERMRRVEGGLGRRWVEGGVFE